MYVHKLGTSWLNHPFFRTSFLLTDPADIRRIHDAGIREVWIDEDKGLPATPEDAPAAPRALPEAPESPESAAPGPEPELAPRKSGRPAVRSMAADIEQARNLCRAAKPQVIDMFEDARMGKAIDPQATAPLVDEIAAAVAHNAAAILSVARLKTHDDYTYLHSVAVAALMVALANQLGFDKERTRLAGMGGLMHDLGKAFMPLEVLNKPGKLTDAEFEIMKGHPVAGARILHTSGAPPEVEDVSLHHHERIDGRGYPHGLKGDAISLPARMGAVCDVYDAVTSVRPYKAPWGPAVAMKEMAGWKGHFDTRVFRAFVKSVGIYPVGALVRLTSQHLAVVVEPGAGSLLTPVVRVFFSLRSNEAVRLRTLDLAAAGCRDGIVGPEDPAKWDFPYLDKLWQ